MSEYLSNMKTRWADYRPTKTGAFWALVGTALGTMILGFTAGGWVTQGGAQKLVEESAEEARAELAAGICVQEFLAAADAGQRLEELKGITSRYQRRKVVQEGGWAAMPGDSDVRASRAAAMECADVLYDSEAPEDVVAER